MKRLLTIATFLLLGAVSFAWLRAREQSAGEMITRLEQQQVEWRQQLSEVESEHKEIRQKIATHRAAVAASVKTDNSPFSAALGAWLAAGDFSNIPAGLVAEFRARLDLPENTATDFVLISKPTLQALRPPSPRKDDKLSDSLCALLSIGSEQRTQIQSALSEARHEFTEWALQNVRREGPEGETLVRYTLPAGNDFADAITNRLLSGISDSIGGQRTALFRTYADTWFQIETGYLGGVTNTLTVLRKPGSDGEAALFYELTRKGHHSSMSEGPGEIHATDFPPAWRNIFPDGWPEVAQREGFDLIEKGQSKSGGK
jgi:hypothetical protein